jgi:hypothetical protein
VTPIKEQSAAGTHFGEALVQNLAQLEIAGDETGETEPALMRLSQTDDGQYQFLVTWTFRVGLNSVR